MNVGLFTISSKNYLAYVRVLMESVARIHPEYRRFLCLGDRVDGYFDISREPYAIVEAEKLEIPNFADFSLRYDIMELNTAVKPFMFRWLFDNENLDAIIYLDPDIQVFSRFNSLESVIDRGASVVLTPHITKPLEDGKIPCDYSMLQAGVFNLGFIAVRRCGESLDFIDWWGRRLLTQCIADFPSNLFVDQKWCDLAPCFLENIKVLRDHGYNVAYWNIAERKIAKDQCGQWLSNEVPLVFFHFSGVVPSDKCFISKHQNRFSWDDVPGVHPLFEIYNNALIQAGWDEIRNWPYAYNALDSDVAINKVLRHFYRKERMEPTKGNTVDITEYLKDMCNERSDNVPEDLEIYITKLMYFIYLSRRDLQDAFAIGSRDGRKQFASWFELTGFREYGLPNYLTCQNLICGKSQLSRRKKKFIALMYQSISHVETFAIKIKKFLPFAFRNILKRYFVALKRRILQGF